MTYCLDSTFLIDFLKGDPQALALSRTLDRYECLVTPINVFEVLSGIYYLKNKHAVALEPFHALLSSCVCLALTPTSVDRAARLHAFLLTQGQRIESTDCLIAGTALTYGCTHVVTRNKRDFERIPGLTIVSY